MLNSKSFQRNEETKTQFNEKNIHTSEIERENEDRLWLKQDHMKENQAKAKSKLNFARKSNRQTKSV